MKTYIGPITKLEENQIFVFGSNTQGKHGKGSANLALRKFGAIYGQSKGLQGKSYAIITKDLTKKIHPSISKEMIIEQIWELYYFAKMHFDLEFLVSYSGTGTNLNGYTNSEMAEMFAEIPIIKNIVYAKEFGKLVEEYNFLKIASL